MEYLILFSILSSLLFFPLCWLKRVYFGRINELNYFNIWFLMYFLLAFMGAFITLAGGAKDSYFISGILYNDEVVGLGSLAILWSGIGMFYTFLIVIFLTDKKKIYTWVNITNKKIKDNSNEIIIIYFFSTLAILSFIYYQVMVYPSPMLLAIQGDPLAAAIKRIDITKDLNLYANTYIVAFGKVISQLFSIQLVLRDKVKKSEYFLKYLMIFISILFILTSGEKAPILLYFLGLYLASNMSNKKILKLNFKLLFYFSFIVLFIYYIVVSNDINEIKKLIFERFIFAQMSIVYYSFDYYNYSNFIGFDSLGGVFNKFFDISVEQPSSVVLMKNYFNEMIANGGWNINGIYISEAWSNFGWYGIIFSPIYVGFLIAICYLLFARKNDSFSRSILIFYTACSFSFLTSINIYIYNTIFILIICIVFLRFILLKLISK